MVELREVLYKVDNGKKEKNFLKENVKNMTPRRRLLKKICTNKMKVPTFYKSYPYRCISQCFRYNESMTKQLNVIGGE